mgnify:CR=1 FL=1
MMAVMMVMTISANAMSYTAAKNEALFLSDKMAYELNLTDAQYDAVYEINLDYLMSVNGRNDVFGTWWNRRNMDLQYVLTAWQYNKYVALDYFYRPMTWNAGGWTFNIYAHYTNRSHFYKARPTVFVTYKGGNNRKADRFYADRHVAKPAPKAPVAKSAPAPVAKPAPTPAAKPNNNATVRNGNRQIAQNTNGNSRNSHFGSRR